MPYRRNPPKQLVEVRDHLQGFVRTGAIVESSRDVASECARKEMERSIAYVLRFSYAECEDNERCISSATDRQVNGCTGRCPMVGLAIGTHRYQYTLKTNTRLLSSPHLATMNTNEKSVSYVDPIFYHLYVW